MEADSMIRFLAGGALVLLTAYPVCAQSYCDQVRQGIEQYGYAAARRYAVEHYSPREVSAADRCVARMRAHSYGHPYHRHYSAIDASAPLPVGLT
jgi:hypothetical protein